MNKEYKILNQYVTRTPLFDLQWIYKKFTDEEIKSFCKNDLFLEAVYLASPELYDQIIKYLNQEIISVDKVEKLKKSILKYILRMSSRCTPFGLFSGIAIGEITKKVTEIEIGSFDKIRRVNRLDMNYLCSLSLELEKKENVYKQLKYYPNTSIYRIGDYYRYVEYKYIDNIRQHFTISIDYSDYIKFILEKTVYGKTIKKIVDELQLYINDVSISKTDLENFILELIENQILISDLSPPVSGNDYLNILCDKTNIPNLRDIRDLITNNSMSSFYAYRDYNVLEKLLKKNNTSINKKYILQTDLEVFYNTNTINESIRKTLKKGLHTLTKLTSKVPNTQLEKFKEEFYRRYEDEEIALPIVLDVESGIGYDQNLKGGYDVNPLIDDLILNLNTKEGQSDQNTIPQFLKEKYLEALKNDEEKIIILESDLSNFEDKRNDLPDTFSILCSLFEGEKKGENLISMSSVGGSSGTYLLGRFGHVSEGIENLINNISELENQNQSDRILAEIIHLPESRTGNILYRKNIRNYEIPYLAKSNLPIENQININDLYLSIKNNKIILRSKKHNKIVEPRLSNAHNYSFNALPIYNFLCDLQTQDKVDYLGINVNSLLKDFKYVPRIQYQNIILSPKKWLLDKKQLKTLKTLDDVFKIKNEMNLDDHILVVEFDNELPINLKDEFNCNLFLEVLKNKEEIILKENLFTKYNSIVKKEDCFYSNEFIFSVCKT